MTYTIRKGDTLWGIAERFLGDGHKCWLIADRNGIANPHAIFPDQQLSCRKMITFRLAGAIAETQRYLTAYLAGCSPNPGRRESEEEMSEFNWKLFWQGFREGLAFPLVWLTQIISQPTETKPKEGKPR